MKSGLLHDWVGLMKVGEDQTAWSSQKLSSLLEGVAQPR